MRPYEYLRFSLGLSPSLEYEERANSISRFYYEPAIDPSPEISAYLSSGAQVDSSKGLDPSEYYKIFTREVPIDQGYCLLSDEIGFSAISIDMPGTTGEMQDWWHSWVTEGDLHYKIWLPGLHVSHHPIKENLGWRAFFGLVD